MLTCMVEEQEGSWTLDIVDMIAIGRRGKPQWTDLAGPRSSAKGHLRRMGRDVVALLIDEALL